MSRIMASLKTDVLLQWRNKLYSIGIVVAVIIAVALSQLADAEQLGRIIPALMLIVIGGSTFLYVAGMILFERDEGTLDALRASPLRSYEYLFSKVVSLTALATLESTLMIGGAIFLTRRSQTLPLPDVTTLMAGIVLIGLMYTVTGIGLVSRYRKITDFLIPMAFVAALLQLPLLYFLGLVAHPVLLIIPTGAPTMLMRAAFEPLTTGEWIYAIGYTGIANAALSAWAWRAFETHVVRQVGAPRLRPRHSH